MGPDSLLESGRGHQIRQSRILSAFQLSAGVSNASVPPASPVLSSIFRCLSACIPWSTWVLCHILSTRGQGIRNYAPVCYLEPASLPPAPPPTQDLILPATSYQCLAPSLFLLAFVSLHLEITCLILSRPCFTHMSAYCLWSHTSLPWYGQLSVSGLEGDKLTKWTILIIITCFIYGAFLGSLFAYIHTYIYLIFNMTHSKYMKK